MTDEEESGSSKRGAHEEAVRKTSSLSSEAMSRAQYPLVVTDPLVLDQYLRLSPGDAALILKKYLVLLVIPRTSMPLDEQLYTILHSTIPGARAAEILVLVDSGLNSSGVHRLPYLNGWFVPLPAPYADAVRTFQHPDRPVLEAVYEKDSVIRDQPTPGRKWKSPTEMSRLCARLREDDAQYKQTKDPEVKRKLRALMSGIAYSPHVKKVPLKKPELLAVIKTAVYDRDPARHHDFNATGAAATVGKGIGVVHMPMPDQILAQATGHPCWYATGDERAAVLKAIGVTTHPLLHNAHYLVSDSLHMPPEWLGERRVIFIGGGLGAIVDTDVVDCKSYLTKLMIRSVALEYGGTPKNKKHQGWDSTTLADIKDMIQSGGVRELDPAVAQAVVIVKASSTQHQRRRLRMPIGNENSGPVALDTAPLCVFTPLDERRFPAGELKNDKRHAWAAVFGVAGIGEATLDEVMGYLKQSKHNRHRLDDIASSINYARLNPKPYPCCFRPGPAQAKTKFTCPFQGGREQGDNVKSCIKHRNPDFDISTVDISSISPGEVWRFVPKK
jgi:hypothetical protein